VRAWNKKLTCPLFSSRGVELVSTLLGEKASRKVRGGTQKVWIQSFVRRAANLVLQSLVR
jgi:hypothetical protein